MHQEGDPPTTQSREKEQRFSEKTNIPKNVAKALGNQHQHPLFCIQVLKKLLQLSTLALRDATAGLKHQ